MTEEQIEVAAKKYLTMYGFIDWEKKDFDAAIINIKQCIQKDEVKAIIYVLTENKP